MLLEYRLLRYPSQSVLFVGQSGPYPGHLTRTDRASAVTIVDASRKHSRASRRYSPARFPISSPRKYAALKEARTLTSQKVPKIFWNQFHWCGFPQIRIEEGIMWLTLASIALASAVTLNILGIFWLSAHRVVREERSPKAGT